VGLLRIASAPQVMWRVFGGGGFELEHVDPISYSIP